MRRVLTILLIASSVAAYAVITSVGVFPGTIEGYDTTAAGSHTSFPVFGGKGVASRIGTGGALLVGGFSSPMTPPNMMFGRGVNVRIRIKPTMTSFGGYFKQAPAGVKVTKVKFNFYDSANVLIGSSVKPLTTAWTWIGFKTSPKWDHVDVIGNGSLPGYVAFDGTRIRP